MKKLRKILFEVCMEFGIFPDELKKSRMQKCCTAKKIYVLAARKLTDCNTSEIGEVIGKDHSTVCIASRRAEELMKLRCESHMRETYLRIIDKFTDVPLEYNI